VREFADLPGTTSQGPLLVDGGTFTWLVTDGWSLSVDTRGDAALQAAAPQAAAPQASE
jgi:hypothetical protein